MIDLFTIISLVVLSGGVQTLLVPKSTYNLSAGSPLFISLIGSITIISLILLRQQYHKVFWLLSKDILPLVLILLIVLSFFWSQSPSITLRRSIALVCNTIFVAFIITRYSIYDFIKLLAFSLVAVMVVTIVISVGYPEIGVHYKEAFYGAWRGAFSHKNRTGQYVVLGMVAYFYFCLHKGYLKKNKVSFISFLIMTGFFFVILKTQSTTSAISVIFLSTAIVIFYIIKYLKKSNAIAFNGILLSLGFIGIILITLYSATIVGFWGKDLSFSGRSSIWKGAIKIGNQHMFLGTGFKGFWPKYGYGKVQITTFAVDHAHNAFVDVYLDLGLVGLIVTTVMFWNLSRKSYLIRNENNIVTSFPFVVTLYILSFSITGCRFIDQNSLFYVIFLTTYFYTTILYREKFISSSISKKKGIKRIV